MKRVVGDQAPPHERPQRVDRLRWKTAAHGFVQRSEERCAVRAQVFEDCVFATIGVVLLNADAASATGGIRSFDRLTPPRRGSG